MAGGLTISTLNDSSGVLATQNGMSGIAKAWVNFNGVTTATIRASFNISSVTRTATGTYTLNFTTAMPDANYAVIGTVDQDSNNAIFMSGGAANYSTTAAANNRTLNLSGPAIVDKNQVQIAVFR